MGRTRPMNTPTNQVSSKMNFLTRSTTTKTTNTTRRNTTSRWIQRDDWADGLTRSARPLKEAKEIVECHTYGCARARSVTHHLMKAHTDKHTHAHTHTHTHTHTQPQRQTRP